MYVNPTKSNRKWGTELFIGKEKPSLFNDSITVNE